MERGLGALNLSLLVLATACRGTPPAAVDDAAIARPTTTPPPPALADTPPPAPPARTRVTGERVQIPASTLRAGSLTGTRLREPAREADAVPVALAAFAIDALPYPNDPALEPRTRVGQAEARALCGERGGRLCSELEWERACKGARDGVYPWADERCISAPESCTTDEGVAALGVWGREWTDSRAGNGVGDSLRSAVVRGALRDAPARAHRCAARDAATPDSKSESLTFRCCYGAPQEARYPEEKPSPPLVFSPLDAKAAGALLTQMPATKHLASDFRPFDADDLQRALASIRAAKTSLAPWQPGVGLAAWSPVARERVQLIAGDSAQGAALVVFYPDVDGAPQLISSYETRGEHAPIVIAGRPDDARQLLFSTCWGCGGEGGALTLGDDGLVRLEPR